MDGFLRRLKDAARVKAWRWRIVCCGARGEALRGFRNAVLEGGNTVTVLLVDAEGPVNQPCREHLRHRDGEILSSYALPDSFSFRVTNVRAHPFTSAVPWRGQSASQVKAAPHPQRGCGQRILEITDFRFQTGQVKKRIRPVRCTSHVATRGISSILPYVSFVLASGEKRNVGSDAIQFCADPFIDALDIVADGSVSFPVFFSRFIKPFVGIIDTSVRIIEPTAKKATEPKSRPDDRNDHTATTSTKTTEPMSSIVRFPSNRQPMIHVPCQHTSMLAPPVKPVLRGPARSDGAWPKGLSLRRADVHDDGV